MSIEQWAQACERASYSWNIALFISAFFSLSVSHTHTVFMSVALVVSRKFLPISCLLSCLNQQYYFFRSSVRRNSFRLSHYYCCPTIHMKFHMFSHFCWPSQKYSNNNIMANVFFFCFSVATAARVCVGLCLFSNKSSLIPFAQFVTIFCFCFFFFDFCCCCCYFLVLNKQPNDYIVLFVLNIIFYFFLFCSILSTATPKPQHCG